MDKKSLLTRVYRKEFTLIAFILFMALMIRLYMIDGYLTFLGDEGRDVRIVRDLINGNLVFIGPQTSIGNMYLGPLYYYMMAPFLWLSNLNPVGPAVMIAILGTITVGFTWWVGRHWFSPLAGLIAALLFALSPVAIIYSKASWNPNPMPFFALLTVWAVWKAWQEDNLRWLPVIGVGLAFALQMHYLALLLFPTIGLFWLLSYRKHSSTQLKKSFINQSILSAIIFLVLMSPLALFDYKHGFPNYNAFKAFFTERQTTINLNPANSDRFVLVLNKVTDDLVMGSSGLYLAFANVVLVLLSAFYAIRTSGHKKQYLLLLAWIIIGYFGLVVYKQHIYAHYFGFLFPAYYLLIGYFLSRLLQSIELNQIIGTFFLVMLVALYVDRSPLNYAPNNQLARTEEAVNQVIAASKGEEFNFALIAKSNYDESYRYFFENKNAPLVRGEDRLTEQLFVICEDGDKCQPEGNPQYQVAIFGIAHVVDEWNLDHLRIYKLIPTKKP